MKTVRKRKQQKPFHTGVKSLRFSLKEITTTTTITATTTTWPIWKWFSVHTPHDTGETHTHLLPVEASPGLKAIGEEFPQGNAVRPDVAGWGELEEVDALRGAPGNG